MSEADFDDYLWPEDAVPAPTAPPERKPPAELDDREALDALVADGLAEVSGGVATLPR